MTIALFVITVLAVCFLHAIVSICKTVVRIKSHEFAFQQAKSGHLSAGWSGDREWYRDTPQFLHSSRIGTRTQPTTTPAWAYLW
jgi:hypothetical protein